MDLERRLDRIEVKLDVVLEHLAVTAREAAVHAAVCDADRADMRRDGARHGTRLWRLTLAVVASGVLGASGGELLQVLL